MVRLVVDDDFERLVNAGSTALHESHRCVRRLRALVQTGLTLLAHFIQTHNT